MLWQYPFLLSLLPGSCTGRSANNPTATHTSNFQQMPDLPLSLSLHLHHWVVSFLDVIQSHFNLREQVNDLLLAAQELARIKTKHKVTSQHILAKPKASPSRDSRKMENLDTWKINVQITLVSSQLSNTPTSFPLNFFPLNFEGFFFPLKIQIPNSNWQNSSNFKVNSWMLTVMFSKIQWKLNTEEQN